MGSVLLSLWNYVENQYQKIFENKSHIFKCNVTFTKRDLWQPMKASVKFKTEKNTEGDCREVYENEKLISKIFLEPHAFGN